MDRHIQPDGQRDTNIHRKHTYTQEAHIHTHTQTYRHTHRHRAAESTVQCSTVQCGAAHTFSTSERKAKYSRIAGCSMALVTMWGKGKQRGFVSVSVSEEEDEEEEEEEEEAARTER